MTPKFVYLVVLGSKGGIGKSVMSWLITNYLVAQGVPVTVIDADPTNRTITSSLPDHLLLNVDLMSEDGSEIDIRKFNGLTDEIGTMVTEGKSGVAIVDIGSNAYLDAIKQIDEVGVEDIFYAIGAEFWALTITRLVGSDLLPTVAAVDDVASRFDATLVVDNRYTGDSVGRVRDYTDAKFAELFEFPSQGQLWDTALKACMSKKVLLQDAAKSPALSLSDRGVAAKIFNAWCVGTDDSPPLFSKSPVLSRIVAIGRGESATDINDFLGYSTDD